MSGKRCDMVARSPLANWRCRGKLAPQGETGKTAALSGPTREASAVESDRDAQIQHDSFSGLSSVSGANVSHEVAMHGSASELWAFDLISCFPSPAPWRIPEPAPAPCFPVFPVRSTATSAPTAAAADCRLHKTPARASADR